MESQYAATLPIRERRLAGRLEGFGDIVFGFAVSQCALQLPTVAGHADISHVISLIAYFGTFAILASLWLTFHALMSGCFRPGRIDTFLAFSYLALVTLMPYALYWTSHRQPTLDSARSAVGQYALIFALLLILAAIVTIRNLRRGWTMLDDDERIYQWRGIVRRVTLGTVIGLAFIGDLIFGPIAGSVMFMTLWIAPRITAQLFKVPRPGLLRIPTTQHVT